VQQGPEMGIVHGCVDWECRAPVAWEGVESDMGEQLCEGCDATTRLHFDCEQLLVSDCGGGTGSHIL
jgi:hypothetical protein